MQPVAANRTDFRDPTTGTFVRVEWTDSPGADAAGAWREAEPGFQARNANYQGLGISPVTTATTPRRCGSSATAAARRSTPGTWASSPPGAATRLMLRTPESQWAASQPLFEQFKQAFQPA